jgi:triacylglycerol esterase/lipase EstA (alpha/beta hydrolase family)
MGLAVFGGPRDQKGLPGQSTNGEEKNQESNIENTNTIEEKIQLKYPVILVHGIAIHDRQSPIDFWGRIPHALREQGVKVYFGNTDAWGIYESNAAILKDTIDQVLAENNAPKVNIIAHSKGGIDSRYAIWRYSYGPKVASLTTLCTPHGGAELADLVYRQDFIHSSQSKEALRVLGTIYGDKHPNMYETLYLLTTEYMQQFNLQAPWDKEVYYQSLYSSMRSSLSEPLFFFSHWYIASAGGENDGLVSEVSAQWGPNQKKIPGDISHLDMVDMKKAFKPGYNIPALYLELVQDLARRGF